MKRVIYTCDICESESTNPMYPMSVVVMDGTIWAMKKDLGHDHVCDECLEVLKKNITSVINDTIEERAERSINETASMIARCKLEVFEEVRESLKERIEEEGDPQKVIWGLQDELRDRIVDQNHKITGG